MIVNFAIVPEPMSGSPVSVAAVASALGSGSIALPNLSNAPLLSGYSIPSSVPASSAVSSIASPGQGTESQPGAGAGTPTDEGSTVAAKIAGVVILGLCVISVVGVFLGRPIVRNMSPVGTPDLSAPDPLPPGWSQEWDFGKSQYVYYPTENPTAPRRYRRPQQPPGPVDRQHRP